MAQTKEQEFGKIRSLFWPIHNYELKKLVPMVLLFFLILFNYTVFRDTKDALVVTAKGGAAEVIPFLKTIGVVPGALLLMYIYSKLVNTVKKETVFYSMIGGFVSFFLLFTFVLYPASDYLHPHAFCDWLMTYLPKGASGAVGIIRNWTFSLYYIMGELWGSAVLSLLFWGFANDITRVSESKRFYSLFGLFGNFALIISGTLIEFFSEFGKNFADSKFVMLSAMTAMTTASGLIIMAIYYWMQKNVLTDKRFYDPAEVKGPKKKKPKMGMGESLKYIMNSKYLGCLALLVIGYGMAINLVEVTWKAQLKLQYPDTNDYQSFMGGFSRATGLVTILMMLFVGGNVRRYFGWRTTALVTPVMLLVTGSIFFSFIIFRGSVGPAIAALGTTPLFLAVVIGMIQNILSKSAKYSLFDPTKESAYIPLDDEMKTKGKAAVDVVGARLGKSGGAMFQMLLISVFGSIGAAVPIIAGFIFLVVGAWIWAANSLAGQFAELSKQREQEALEASQEEAAPQAAKTEEVLVKA